MKENEVNSIASAFSPILVHWAKKAETYEDQEWKWKTSGSGKQRAFATPPADEGSAGCTPEAGRVVPEQPETT